VNITWKAARDVAVGDRIYVRPLGGPDEVLHAYQETAEGSRVSLTRWQVRYGEPGTSSFVGRLSHEMVAVETS
jgi:hypothetical protein